MSGAAARSLDPGATEVHEVMSAGVVAVPENASVLEARRAMQKHDVHAVLVVEHAHGRPMGVITPRGLLKWLGRDEAAGYARDAISQSPVWILPDASVREAAALLLDGHLTHLLVRRRDEELPEGLVTARDLLPRDP